MYLKRFYQSYITFVCKDGKLDNRSLFDFPIDVDLFSSPIFTMAQFDSKYTSFFLL